MNKNTGISESYLHDLVVAGNGDCKMTSKEQQFINQYAFISNLRNCKLVSITSAMPEPDSHVITDSASLNFSNGKQIVVESSYQDMDLLFCYEEDVLLDIRQESNYEVVSNRGNSSPICTILVDETPLSVQLVFDEIRYADNEDDVRFFPVGIFIDTPQRKIGIWREMLEAFFLAADYNTASKDAPYSLRDKWEGWEADKRYMATRYSYDFFSSSLLIIDKLESSIQ